MGGLGIVCTLAAQSDQNRGIPSEIFQQFACLAEAILYTRLFSEMKDAVQEVGS